MNKAAALLVLLCAASLAQAGAIEVRVAGVEGNEGLVRVAVCDKERFLKQCRYTGTAPAQAGETVVTVQGVPAGSWAVLSFQDVNRNGDLDRNLIGIPTENYGFSRDARGKFGPPSFDDAAVTVGEEPTVVRIKLK